MNILEVKNLRKVYNSEDKNTEVVALKDINFEVEEGEFVAIMGESGSGKSTLFKLICDILEPDNGCIILSEQAHIGALIENPGFLPSYTGRYNLKLLADIKNIINYEKIDETLNLVGLDCNDKRKYKQYSLGMKQKLGIAQALMEDPELILLDEPTNALDEKSVENILSIIEKEKAKDKLILIASHDKLILEQICDEIINIENGRII